MLDQVTSTLTTVLQAKRDTDFQKKVTDGMTSIEDLASELTDILNETYSMFQDYTENALDEQDRSISALYDIYDQMLENQTQELTENISDLGAGKAEEMVAVGDTADDEKNAILHTISGSILSLLKINQDGLSHEVKEERILNNIQKGLLKNEKKTKTAEATPINNSQGGEIPPIDPTKIDMSGIAKSMAQATAAQLSPAKLIKEFFTAMLPYIIIFGLLLYGFVVGFMDGDFMDFVMILGGIVVAAFLAYIAWQMVKAGILLAFQMMCEMLKVALAAQPALAAMIAIGIIQIAFLLAAGLLVIMVAAALAILLVSIGIVLKLIVDAVIALLDGLLTIIVKIPLMILESFAKMIRILFAGDDGEDNNKATGKIASLLKDDLMPKLDEIINAIYGLGNIEINTDDSSLSSLSDGFGNLDSSLNDMNRNMEELMNEKKNPEQTGTSNFTLFSYLASLSSTTDSIRGLVRDILDSNVKKDAEIIKQSVTSAIQESKNSSYTNSYTVSDGAAVLQNAATLYAQNENQASSGTDLSGITKQLSEIITCLNNMVSAANNAAREEKGWSFLNLS